MSRLEKWKKPKRILAALTGKNEKLLKILGEVQKHVEDEDKPSMSSIGIISASKELIFDVENDIPTFHFIMYTLNVDTAELELHHILSQMHDNNKSAEEIEEDIIKTLAFAALEEVPVYPNEEFLYVELAKYHRKMLIDGFSLSAKKGEKTKYILTSSPGNKIDNPRYIEELNPITYCSPIEISLIKDLVVKELKRLESTERLLYSLRDSINGFEFLLNNQSRNENALQRHLTENPVLFGLDYARVIPKHTLGSEYEMDYALERHSGFYDLVEIESSCLKLYTKGGNPSSSLVHAEQQVLDWLNWVEAHNPYAREKLPGLISPQGYVIIGLRSSLSESDAKKLKRRNAIFEGNLQIMTYDDLLDRAKNILSQLESLRA